MNSLLRNISLMVVVAGFSFAGEINLLNNGNFETGDLSEWETISESQNNGSHPVNIILNDGSYNPYGPTEPQEPISGDYDLLFDMDGPSTHVISQPIYVSPEIVGATISWRDRIFNHASHFHSEEQYFRVELLNQYLNPIAEIFSTNPGDLNFQAGPNSRTYDATELLADFVGQNIYLSFSQVTTLFYMNVFLDNIMFIAQTNDDADPITSLDIDGESGWQLFSSPVEGAILSDLLDELWTQGSINSDLYWGDPNVFTYDEGWNPVMDLNTHVLSAGQGIAVYVFSDTDDDGEDDLPVTIGLDDGYTEYEDAVSTSTNESSYNLLGNPYAFSVDIAQLSVDNPTYGSSVYVWDRSISSYRVHNGTTGDIADGLLAPFQGFWVQSNADGNSYSFSEESISNDQGTNYRTTDDESNGSAVFTFSTGEFSSSVFLSFTPEGEINLDAGDADRFMPISGTEHLTSMIYESTKSLAINNLPLEMNTDITLDMDVMMLEPSDVGYETQQSQVNMSWDMSNLPEGINVALQNNVTGYMVNLDGYPSMNITLPSKGGFEFNSELMETYPEVGESQFTLIITTDFASSDDDELTTANNFKLHNAYPNPFNPSTKIRFDLTEVDMVSMDVFDISGRQVATLINEIMIPGSHEVNWNPGDLSSGVYLIKLNAGENSMNQKVTYIK